MLLLKTLLSFFTAPDKRFSMLLLMLMLITAIVELAGIGSLFPYIKILGSKEYIHKSHILDSTYQFFHFKTDDGFLIFIGALIFCTLLLKAALSILNNYYQARLTYRINNRLSKSCLNSYMAMPYSKVIDKNSTILSKHLLVDVTSVGTLIQAALTMMTDVIVALALVALMISVNPLLVLSVVGSLGVLVLFINRFLKRRINALSVANEYCNRFAYKTASESLSSLKDIQIYNVREYFINRYLKWQYQISKQMIEFSVVSNLPTNILNVIGFGVLLIVLLYLIISHGNLMVILPTIGLIAVSIQRLLPLASRITTSIANIRRSKPLVLVVKDAIDFFSKQDSKSIAKRNGSDHFNVHFKNNLSLENVSYAYPGAKSKALDSISIDIKKQSIFGIVGESGAGKSTLVDVLLGLLPVSAGAIVCDGKRLLLGEGSLLSHLVGYVPQQVFLLDGTIKENITFGVDEKDIDEDAINKAIEVAQLKQFIDQQPDGLLSQIGEKGIKISGGQRQRIGIARALYRDPDILILDEATNALDAATENEFNNALKALMNKKTLIIVAHRLSAVSMCQQIVQLDQGRIVASGSFDELSKHSESFRRIYNLSETSA